jgi:hypothetical protein
MKTGNAMLMQRGKTIMDIILKLLSISILKSTTKGKNWTPPITVTLLNKFLR